MNKYLHILRQSKDSNDNTTSRTQTPSSSYHLKSIVMQALSDPLVFYGFDELKEECLRQTNTSNQIRITTTSTSSSTGTVSGTTTSSNSNNRTQDEKTLDCIFQTLDLFAYGTFQDYHVPQLQLQLQQQEEDKDGHNHSDNEEYKKKHCIEKEEVIHGFTMNTEKYIRLTESQIWKLKALSVLTIIDEYIKSILNENESHQNPTTTTTTTTTSHVQDDTNHRSTGRQRRQEWNLHTSPRSSNTSSSCRIIPYAVFQKGILLETTTQVEELLLHCIYSNLLPNGTKLDPKHACLELGLVIPNSSSSSSSSSNSHPIQTKNNTTITSIHIPLSRDVPMEEIPYMMNQLKEFLRRGISAKQKLEQSIHVLHDTCKKEQDDWNMLRHYLSTMELSVSTTAVASSSLLQKQQQDDERMVQNPWSSTLNRKDALEGGIMMGSNSISSDDNNTAAWWKDAFGSERHGKRSKGDDGNLL